MTGIVWMLVGLARADEPLDVAQIPDAVKATIAREWPTAKTVSAERDGQEVEVIVQVDARTMEVAFGPDGSWTVIEEKVEVATLPDAVRTAAMAQGALVGAEKQTFPGGKIGYEVKVKAKGKVHEMKFDDAGHPVASDEEEEEENEGKEKEDDDGDGH